MDSGLALRAPRNDGIKVIVSQLHARPRRGLADIFLGLLERVFQRFRFSHVADLGEDAGDPQRYVTLARFFAENITVQAAALERTVMDSSEAVNGADAVLLA